MAALPATIDATRAEIERLNAESEHAFGDPHWNHGNQRTKTFGQRTDAAIRRAAQHVERVKVLERHLAALERAASSPAPKPAPTVDEIRSARLIRTKLGWERVVKVNRTTVTVEAEPGWNNKVSFRKILEVR